MSAAGSDHGDPEIGADQVKQKKVKYLWRQRIPRGMLSVVAGKPDQGKGLLSIHIAAEVTRKGGKVFLSAAEDDHAYMTVPRLKAAGADLSKVTLWNFVMPEQQQEFARRIRTGGYALAILDPFEAHLEGVTKHGGKIRSVLNPLKALATETGCAILVIEHQLKRTQKNAHPLAAIAGSGSGLAAAARAAYIFGVDPDEDRRVLCVAKLNFAAKPKPLAFQTDEEDLPDIGGMASLIVEGECEFDVQKIIDTKGGDGKPGRKPDKRAAAAEWLTQYLMNAPGPMLTSEVKEDGLIIAGIAKKTLKRAADDMGVIIDPPGGGAKCTWALPDDVKQAYQGLGGDDA